MIQCILTPLESEDFRTVPAEDLDRPTFKVLCPWHHETTPSCVISLERALFYCFGCSTSGRVLLAGEMDEEEFLQEYRAIAAQDVLSDKETRRNSQQWWDAYRQYLTTPAWREKRWKVMQRANYTCEGCGTERATQVHHLTYERVSREMLFDLVAICDECHDSIHERKDFPL